MSTSPRLILHAALTSLLCGLTGHSASGASVAVLVENGASMYQKAAQGFQESFRDLQPVQVIRLNGDPRERAERLAALRRNPPRLIVAIGTQVARDAREKLPYVPILYCLALSPVQNNLVGPDIGGVAFEIELPQQIARIQKALPGIRRLGVIYDEPTSGRLVRQARHLLTPSVQLVVKDARSPREAAQKIEELQGQVDAFWLLWDPVILNPANFRRLVDFGLKNKVKIIAPAAPFVEAGALLSVGADNFQAGRQTGEMAQQVLAGTARPEAFEAVPPGEALLTINGSVARRLGITFPADLQAEILLPGDKQ